MITRSQRRAAESTNNARPPPPPASSSSSSTPSSGDEFATAPDTDGSSDESGPPPPPPPRPPARRWRPPLPARLGPAGHPAPPTAPAAGGIVRRMRWTREMNENVMRAYYGATEGGTQLSAYRSRILPLFQALEPTITVSEQRLSDQVRVIQRLKRLDDATLDRLRQEALSARADSTSVRDLPAMSPDPVPAPDLAPGAPQVDVCTDEGDFASQNVSTTANEQLRRTLEEAITQYRATTNSRPRLPRLPMNRRNLALMGALNALLEPHLRTSKDLDDTHSIMYCGAIAACRVARVKFPDAERAPRTVGGVPAWQTRIERRISSFRTLIAKLICFRGGNNRPRVMRFVNQAAHRLSKAESLCMGKPYSPLQRACGSIPAESPFSK
ncbi:ras and Rab interactor 3-like [Cydia amplana]|uniref:ras and Rab interactor 3-like n=1 Tax=Cydia amplana TaxID=1869771 RepID=UPI002FE693F1